ncbi:MAG: restriction endonuclease subunit S [Candidatus Competibacteraceae bacterium]
MLPNFWSYKTVLSFKHPIDQTVQTGPFGAQLHSDDYVDEGVPFILIKNIKDGTIDPEGMPCITHADARRLANYVLQKNDIVFSRVGRVGSCFLVEDEHIGWVISGQLLRLRLDLSNLDPHFLIHWIRSQYVERYIGNESVGSTRQSINSNILSNMPIPNIPLVEQRHITYILDTLDTTIRQTEAIIAKLQQVKQGLLHDLMTRGIDANGQLRPPVEQAPHLYKESPLGWIPREWDVKDLSTTCEYIIDCPHSTPNFQDDGVLVARTMHIKEGEFYITEASKVSEKEYLKRIARLKPTAGDVVFTREAPVGEAFVIPIGMNICLGQRVMLLRPRYGVLQSDFLLAQIYSGAVKERIATLTAGTTNPHLNVSEVKIFEIPLPPYEEQEAISANIEGISRRQRREHSKLEKLTKAKSALMDDLLTGRVRVTALLSGQTPASKELERESA